MTDFAAATSSQANPFDARGPFLLSLFMTLVGYSVLVALPAINSAWVDQLGFTDVQVNRVASADLLGLFIGAVLTSGLIRRWSRQGLTYLGLLWRLAPTPCARNTSTIRHHCCCGSLRDWVPAFIRPWPSRA